MQPILFISMVIFWTIVARLIYKRRLKKNNDHYLIVGKLKSDYEQALASGNKEAAAKTGEAYFSKLRNGTLYSEDRETIKRDISRLG